MEQSSFLIPFLTAEIGVLVAILVALRRLIRSFETLEIAMVQLPEMMATRLLTEEVNEGS